MKPKLPLFIFIGLIFFILLLEVSLRIFASSLNSQTSKAFFISQDKQVKRLPQPTWQRHPDKQSSHPVFYNTLGLRDSQSVFENGPQQSICLLLIGDTFLDNPYVQEKYLISHLLEKILNFSTGPTYRVHNAGLPGSALDSQSLWLDELLPKLEPTVVIHCYTSDDLDDIARQGLISLDSNNQLVYSLAPTSFLLRQCYLFRFFHNLVIGDSNPPYQQSIAYNLCHPQLNQLNQNRLKVYRALVEHTQQLVTNQGARFNALIIPQPQMYETTGFKPQRHLTRIKNIYGQLGIESIDLFPLFSDYFKELSFNEKRQTIYFKNQPYLNENGNLVVALTLVDAILPDAYKTEEFMRQIHTLSQSFRQ